MSKNCFARFEERIERLVEGSFARLFAGHLHPRQVAVQLARAMEDAARTDVGHKRATAPDTYTVFINPQDYTALLEKQPDLASALASHLVELATRADMRLNHFPAVRLAPSVSVARQQVRVSAKHRPGPVSTNEMGGGDHPAAQAPPPPNARLRVEGTREIALNQRLVNIGRRLDNHIVIDDTRISRRHAQLQLRGGRYVLFDLGSRQGTRVNGQVVEECILRSGDRITFGSVPTLYLDDAPPARRQDTQIYRPSDER